MAGDARIGPQPIPPPGLGLAVMDRLRRAARDHPPGTRRGKDV
jgi:hypothetical protein